MIVFDFSVAFSCACSKISRPATTVITTRRDRWEDNMFLMYSYCVSVLHNTVFVWPELCLFPCHSQYFRQLLRGAESPARNSKMSRYVSHLHSFCACAKLRKSLQMMFPSVVMHRWLSIHLIVVCRQEITIIQQKFLNSFSIIFLVFATFCNRELCRKNSMWQL